MRRRSSYFATPVGRDLPDAEPTAELRRSSEREPGSACTSNLGGYSRADFEMGGPGARRACSMPREPRPEDSDRAGKGAASPEDQRANVNRQAGNDHTHPGPLVGHLLRRRRGIGDDRARRVEMDSRGVAPAMYALLLGFAVPEASPLAPASWISQEWSSSPSVLHAVRPYRGARERISVAFNFGLMLLSVRYLIRLRLRAAGLRQLRGRRGSTAIIAACALLVHAQRARRRLG
jgi:hypothetical protein